LSKFMPLPTGKRLGPYEILTPLGAGGMGEVYRARDSRLHRDVAIKVLPEHLAKDPQALARFEREVRAVAALSHPNILAIYDVGSDQGVNYAVTELLEGETIRSRLARGAIQCRKAIEIGVSIAEGLSAAHSKGILHRDLKPENIFLTANGHVKILDFGLAQWRPTNSSQNQTSAPTKTEPGTVMGTVGYMSPEQVRGGVADASSDIFSLGCVLYEIIAGRRAFARETAAQTMTAILEHHPPPLAESGKRIPPELDRIIARCLEKNSGERIQSARDLSYAFKDLLSAAEALPSAPRTRRFRHGPAVLVAAAFVVIVIAAGFYRLNWRDQPIGSLAVLPFVNAGGNPEMEYLGDGITESLINSLSQVPNLAVMSRNSVFNTKGRQNAQAAGQLLRVQAVLTGRVVQHGDNLSISAELIEVRNNRHLWGEQFNRRLVDILAVQEEISTEISEKLRFKLTGEEKKRLTKRYTQNTAAYQFYLKGRFYLNKKTPQGFDKAIEYFQRAVEADPNYAPAYSGLADSYNILGSYSYALVPPKEAWAKAKEAAEKAIRIDETLAAAHTSLAYGTFLYEWDWLKSEREFKHALELDSGSSFAFHWYSHYLVTMGRNKEALKAGQRALELDPLDLPINAHQGWYYLFVPPYHLAIEPLQKTIEMDSSFALAHWYLGLAYEQQGTFKDAIAEFEKAVSLTNGRPSLLALLGHAYAAANRRSEAQGILDQLGALSKEKYVASYPVAVLHVALGHKEEAFTGLEKAYDEHDSWLNLMKLDRRLDGLHSDPRFVDLLRRVNLAP
jgi:serine/threonine protein kinase/tetratricopeptide (TPR) repeat protein